jgi:hypothetical protein
VYIEFAWLGGSPFMGYCLHGDRFQVLVNVGKFVTRLLASPEGLYYLELLIRKGGIFNDSKKRNISFSK